MKARHLIAKPNSPSLWSIVPLVSVCLVTTFMFWMSPLGLGFSDQASEKFGSGVASDLFTFVFLLGPISIVFTSVFFIIALFGFIEKRTTNWIVGTMMIVTIIAQILTLIYLTA